MTLGSIARKSWRAAPAVIATVLVVFATGCSAGCSASVSFGHVKTGGTYSGHGVSLTIPHGWSRLRELTLRSKTGTEIWSEGFAPQSGSDLVGITAYATNVAVTRRNSDRYAPKVTAAIENLAASSGGRLLSGPTPTVIDGMAGYRFETTLAEEGSATLESRMFLVWKGQTEYFINCQHRTRSSIGAEIERGCNTIKNSFKLD